MRPSRAARKSGLWLPQARSSRISRRSAGSSYVPTASSRPLDGHEHGGRAPSERLGSGLGDRLERRGAGQRLPEHRSDAVEAALDPRLPRALREHLGVAQRERGEPRERLEDVRVPVDEARSLAPPDAEHPVHLVAPEHRRGDHVGEAVVGRVRNRRRDLAVRALDQRPSLADGGARQALAHRELEVEQRPVEAVHRDAAEEAALAVEEVAVGGIGVEQLGELVGQPLQDDRQVELAAEHVRRPEQGALLRELLLVPLQRLLERDAGAQPLERDGRLGGERLHHREIVGREDPRLVERRDRDHRGHPFLDEQRDERGALRSDGVDESPADDTRAGRVVHRHRRRLEDGARDSRRLALEVETQVAPPVDVLPTRAREIAGRLVSVVGDERERRETDVEELRDLVEQRPRDALDVCAPRQLVGDAADALELPRAAGSPALLRAAAAENGRQEQHGGRGAAERANGRKLWGPHWAVEIVRSGARPARNRPRTWKSPPLGGSVRRALPIAPRKASEDAAVRIAQWEGG